MENTNNGVCCDVCSCKYNERGCDCNLEKIRVTSGDGLKKHICGSFECKEEFQDINDELKI